MRPFFAAQTRIVPMKLSIKFFAEITIKSPQVRKRFVQPLRKNRKAPINPIDPELRHTGTWDSLEIITGDDPAVQAQVIERLQHTPGINHIHEVREHELGTLEELAELCVARFAEQLRGKTFAVRCKRIGKHPFSSTDVNRLLGSRLMEASGAAGVSLKAPDVEIQLEIRQQRVFLIQARHEGMGGF